MRHAASVTLNVAQLGGGVYASYSDVVLRDRASIKENLAGKTGGGVYALDGRIFVHRNATISANTPNDTFARCVTTCRSGTSSSTPTIDR
jgi:hypothetical protein